MPGDNNRSSAQGDCSEGTTPFCVPKPPVNAPAELRIRRRSVPEVVEDDSLGFHAKRCSILLIAGLVSGVRHLVIKAEDMYSTLKRRCIESSRLRRIGVACGRAHRAIKKQLQESQRARSYSPSLGDATSSGSYCAYEHSDSDSDPRVAYREDPSKKAKLQVRWLPEVVPEQKSSNSEPCSFHDFFKSLHEAENRSVLDNFEIIEYVKAKRRRDPNEAIRKAIERDATALQSGDQEPS